MGRGAMGTAWVFGSKRKGGLSKPAAESFDNEGKLSRRNAPVRPVRFLNPFCLRKRLGADLSVLVTFTFRRV